MGKQEYEVILTICMIFLSTVLVLSMLNGKITGMMVLGALAVTYIFVHYWEKCFLRQKMKKVK